MTNHLSKDCKASEEKKHQWKMKQNKSKGGSKGKNKSMQELQQTVETAPTSETMGLMNIARFGASRNHYST